MTEFINDPIIEAIFSDGASIILLIFIVIFFIPAVIKLAIHIVSILFLIIKGFIRLIAWMWTRWEDEIKKWYHEDFLSLFKSKRT